MTLHRSYLPLWLKVWSLPLLLWVALGLTLLRGADTELLALLRDALLPYAILATVGSALVAGTWQLWRVMTHAK